MFPRRTGKHYYVQHSPPHANNEQDFIDATHLFYDRQSVTKFNYEKLCTLGMPIAAVSAIYSSPAAAATKSEDIGGLLPVCTCSVVEEVIAGGKDVGYLTSTQKWLVVLEYNYDRTLAHSSHQIGPMLQLGEKVESDLLGRQYHGQYRQPHCTVQLLDISLAVSIMP